MNETEFETYLQKPLSVVELEEVGRKIEKLETFWAQLATQAAQISAAQQAVQLELRQLRRTQDKGVGPKLSKCLRVRDPESQYECVVDAETKEIVAIEGIVT